MPQSQQSELGTSIIFDRIKSDEVVLDVGCGEGKWGKLLKQKVARIDGVEVWKPYIENFNLEQFYSHIFNVDVMSFEFNSSYDSIILGDVLEHLEKDQAIKLISKLKTNSRRIYLTIPISVCIQDGELLGNPYETHRYHWSDKEIRYDLGFKLLNISVNENGLVAIGCYEWSGN